MYNLQLETFIVVADLGSFNKAAESLYITPPAVTKQINLLEKDLGLTLFIRTHRGLVLTEAGKGQRHPHWNFSHDPINPFGAEVVSGTERISRYQASDDSFYEQPGECPGDSEKSGKQY